MTDLFPPRKYEHIPQEVLHTQRANLLRAAKFVKPKLEKPCAYEPWQIALEKFGANAEYDLMRCAYSASYPGWPECDDALFDFAFTFLETDVMLFRSGYTKRHIINRLKQADLAPRYIERTNALIKRAILFGTGKEEAKAYRSLAARHINPDLESWLAKLLKDVLSEVGHLNPASYYRVFDTLSEKVLMEFSIAQGRNFTSERYAPTTWAHVREFYHYASKTTWRDHARKAVIDALKTHRFINSVRASKPTPSE